LFQRPRPEAKAIVSISPGEVTLVSAKIRVRSSGKQGFAQPAEAGESDTELRVSTHDGGELAGAEESVEQEKGDNWPTI
jgi:hypothetical protein